MKEVAQRAQDVVEAQRMARLAFWRWTPATKKFSWSLELYRLLGREPGSGQESLEHTFAHVHPDDREETMRVLMAIVSERRELAHEYRAIKADGTIINLWSTTRIVLDGKGEVAQVRGICQDITDRARAEAILRESEENHRYAVELSPQMPWTADSEGKILEVSPRWARLTGVPEQQLIRDGWWSIVHPDDEAAVKAVWFGSLESQQPGSMELRIRLADGSYRWLRASAAPRLDEQGKVLRWYGAAEDIHDRKLAEAALRESEDHYRHAVELNPQIPWTADPEGNVLEMGPRWPELLGMTREEALGQGWSKAVHPDDLARTVDGWRMHLASAEPVDHEYRLRLKDGTYSWMRIRAAARKDENGAVFRWYGTIEDIQEHKSAQLALQASEARLSAILESTTDNVVVVDRDWRVTYLNRHAAEFFGPARPLCPGLILGDAFPEEIGGDLSNQLLAAAAQSRAAEFEVFFAPSQSWIEVHAFPTHDGLSIFFRDVTEVRHSRQKLEYLARHDVLTGLANRAMFNEELASAFAEAGDAAIAVLHLDLDEFKSINDTLGHPVGDALLQQTARRFGSVVSSTCTLARLGGDEFAIVCPTSVHGSTPLELADRLQDCLKETFNVDGHTIRMGVSIGIAIGRLGEERPEELFKKADIALYRAKADGRGSYRVYESGMHEQLEARQAMKADLAEALEKGQLEIHFQPLLDLVTNHIVSFEALLRWRHPERGLVPPCEFIPLAEETGLILGIGEWVLAGACQAARSWPAGISVAVNLSPLQFRDRALPLTVAKILGASGLRSSQLQLEITETVLLQDSEHNTELLRALKQLGVGIALDDFGTGFSSLSYLRSFEFDKLKIDRSFINDIGSVKNSEEIVRAVIGLAHALGLAVVAEGVETNEQRSWLTEAGCHQAQGYLISRPVPESQVLPLLMDYKASAA